MDVNFLTNGDIVESTSTTSRKISFTNIDFYNYKDPFDSNFIKSEEMSIIFNKEARPISFSNTYENSGESKLNEDDNKKKENELIIHKKFIESIKSKVKENILSKRPFKDKNNIGRKKKEYKGIGNHTKFSDDNIIKKVKNAVLQIIRIFINQKIKTIYEYKDDKNLKEKKLFKLKQNESTGPKTDYIKDFLEKTLGVIFSGDISSKISLYPLSHNKKLIETLINDSDEKKRNIFNKIFNLTFSDCLNHFRGSRKIEALEGLNNLDDYLKEQKINNDEEYCTLFKYFVNNLEMIINTKKSRVRLKK